MQPADLIYRIALTLIDGIGDVNAKSLLAYCGSAEEVFRQKKSHLTRIPGIGEKLARAVTSSKDVFTRAEEEAAFTEKFRIRTLFFTDDDYPSRLKYCSDGPVMLYYKGSVELNASRFVAIVGTRRPSDYGRAKTEELVHDLSPAGVVILSGLAYGVDVIAHRAAINCGMCTVGVLGHGLDRIYPAAHDKLARKMVTQGGLLTDFMSGTKPDAMNFPKRNRIVAGLCDALVVVESRRTGGSLITATIANSYNKDVFAIPGRAGEPLSEGGNGLIKRNRAALIESAEDLLDAMQWRTEDVKTKKPQMVLPVNLSDDELKVYSMLSDGQSRHIDDICHNSGMPMSRVSMLLLQLELNNLVKSLPGKMYQVS